MSKRSSAIFEQAAQQWADMRYDFERYIDAAYDRALEACAGVLVNKEGRAAHIDGYSLFTGPKIRAYRFASEELKEHWQYYPRLSMTEFEQQWLSGSSVQQLERAA